MKKLRLVLILGILAGLCPAVAWSQMPPPPPPQAEPDPLRVEVRVVNVFATVRDRQGRLMPNLTKADFEVLEDGQPKDIDYFARENEMSLLLLFLVDTSTSQKRIIAKEQKIAAEFAQRVLRPGDQVALAAFDSNAYMLQEPTSDPAELGKAWERIVPFAPGFKPQLKEGKKVNGTRMCAALAWAADFQPKQLANRKVIVLITDGVDAELNTDLRPSLETVLRNDVMVYTIRAMDAGVYAWWDKERVEAGDRAMRQFAKESGGAFYVGNNADRMESAFAEIAAEVRSQYGFGFAPRYMTYNARFHKITVNVKTSGASVRARRGYYSPSN